MRSFGVLMFGAALLACNAASVAPNPDDPNPDEVRLEQQAQLPVTQRKLLEVNGGRLSATQFKANNYAALNRLNASIFEGTVLRSSTGTQLFTLTPIKTIFGTPDAFASDRAAMADLKSRSAKLSNSFLLINVLAAAEWDWFNDAHWASVQSNILEQVKLAQAAGLRGIAFDMEQYPNGTPNPYTRETYSLKPWDYRSQAHASSKSFQQYQLQVRKRGQQFIQAVQNAWPGVTIFCYYLTSISDGTYFVYPGHDYAWMQQWLKDDDDGLWHSFYNGWLDWVAGSTKLVDGNEHAYDYTRPEHWEAARTGLMEKAPVYHVDPKNRSRYARNVSFGNGIYFDGAMNVYNAKRYMGFHATSDLERSNLLEQSVYHALRTSDEFAWLDSETHNWFTSAPTGTSTTALQALERGKRKLQSGQALGLDMGFVDRLMADWAQAMRPSRIHFPR